MLRCDLRAMAVRWKGGYQGLDAALLRQTSAARFRWAGKLWR